MLTGGSEENDTIVSYLPLPAKIRASSLKRKAGRLFLEPAYYPDRLASTSEFVR